MYELKLKKEFRDLEDELKSSEVFDETIRLQTDSALESIKSMKLQIIEEEKKRKNLQIKEEKKMKILKTGTLLVKAADKLREEVSLQNGKPQMY